MKNLKKDDFFGAVILFLFGCATVILSSRMPLGTFRMAGPGLFPFCLGILLMVLSAFYLGRLCARRKGESEKKEQGRNGAAPSGQLGLFLGAMVLATFFFNTLGYPLVSFLLMLSLLRVLGMKRWGLNLLIAGVTTAGSYLLFVQWLQIPLPKGWIGL